MSGNTFGTNFRVTTFGESHGVGICCNVDGCPAGFTLTQEIIQKALDRRRPGAKNPDGTQNAAVPADGKLQALENQLPINLMQNLQKQCWKLEQ